MAGRIGTVRRVPPAAGKWALRAASPYRLVSGQTQARPRPRTSVARSLHGVCTVCADSPASVEWIFVGWLAKRLPICHEPSRSDQGSAVHDNGDTDRLGEDIGERISKTLSRDAPSDDAKRQITQVIAEKINRKSASGSAALKKGVMRANLMNAELILTPEERAILDAPHEIVVVYGPDARLIKAVTDYESEWSSVPMDLKQGSWFSHQHPGGRGPSSWDLDFLSKNRHLISRIVAINETGNIEIFEISVDPDAADADPLILNDAVDFYRDAAQSLGDTAPARREALELLSVEFPATFHAKSRVL